MTESDKAKLAKFAGGKYIESSGYRTHRPDSWKFPDGKYIECHDWSPSTNPAHGDPVLRALVEKMGWGWVREEVFMVGWKANKPDKDASWFWPAVCQAALEVID